MNPTTSYQDYHVLPVFSIVINKVSMNERCSKGTVEMRPLKSMPFTE